MAKDIETLISGETVQMRLVTLKTWCGRRLRFYERSYLIHNGRRLLRRNRVDLKRVSRSTPEYLQSRDERQTRERHTTTLTNLTLTRSKRHDVVGTTSSKPLLVLHVSTRTQNPWRTPADRTKEHRPQQPDQEGGHDNLPT